MTESMGDMVYRSALHMWRSAGRGPEPKREDFDRYDAEPATAAPPETSAPGAPPAPPTVDAYAVRERLAAMQRAGGEHAAAGQP